MNTMKKIYRSLIIVVLAMTAWGLVQPVLAQSDSSLNTDTLTAEQQIAERESLMAKTKSYFLESAVMIISIILFTAFFGISLYLALGVIFLAFFGGIGK